MLTSGGPRWCLLYTQLTVRSNGAGEGGNRQERDEDLH
jgi:hypothetical protein